jgi:MFS family permease
MIALLENAKKVYNDYPRAFWIYNLIVFIDRLGGFMLYPFFALYLTQKFNIGMSTVGILFAIFSLSGMVGSALGGALADRMGRKVVIIFSLVLSSLSALGMGFAPTLEIFIAVVAIVGTLSSIGHLRMRRSLQICSHQTNVLKATASSVSYSIWR